MGLQVDTSCNAAVGLGDGLGVWIIAKCRGLWLELGTTKFEISCYVFQLSSVDIILGVFGSPP